MHPIHSTKIGPYVPPAAPPSRQIFTPCPRTWQHLAHAKLELRISIGLGDSSRRAVQSVVRMVVFIVGSHTRRSGLATIHERDQATTNQQRHGMVYRICISHYVSSISVLMHIVSACITASL